MMICFSFNFEAADGAFEVFIAAIVVSFAMLFYVYLKDAFHTVGNVWIICGSEYCAYAISVYKHQILMR